MSKLCATVAICHWNTVFLHGTDLNQHAKMSDQQAENKLSKLEQKFKKRLQIFTSKYTAAHKQTML